VDASPRKRANSYRSVRPARSSRIYRIDSEGNCRRRPSCSRLIRGCCATAASRLARARRCALSRRFVDGRLSDEALSRMTDEEVEATLTEVSGIGPWTALFASDYDGQP
jgi:hypothetical protein